MGRLLLNASVRLGWKDQSVAWIHIRWNSAETPESQWHRIRNRLPSAGRFVRISPFEIAGQPARMGTVLVLAEDQQTLRQAIDVLV